MNKLLKPNKRMRELLSFTPLQYMMDSMEENPKLADYYIDKAENTCFILMGVYLFVAGEVSKEALDYLDKQILTEKARENLGIILVFYPNKDWEDAITNMLPNNNKIYPRSVYRIKPKQLYNDFSNNEGVNISRINSELLNSNVENLSMILDEVTSYADMEDFVNRGIGFTPIVNNKVCGFCTSEYPTKTEIAIGIEVLEEYQKKGIAKTMTKMLLNEAFKRNLTVYWECWKNNIASVNTALSCGFEKVSDYSIIFAEL